MALSRPFFPGRQPIEWSPSSNSPAHRMLCADCTRFCETLSPEPTRHKVNPHALKISCQEGCRLCKILLPKILRSYAALKDQDVHGNRSGKPPEEQIWLRMKYSDGTIRDDESDLYRALPKGYEEVTDALYPFWLEVMVRAEVPHDELWITLDLCHHFSSINPNSFQFPQLIG